MKIAIGNDHPAVELKNIIVKHLESKGIDVIDFGTQSTESTHYPIYAASVAQAVTLGEVDFGILICGTGIGMSVAANKVKGIRAACVSEPYSARMARAHNNANILTFGARVVGPGLALEIVDTWLEQDFEDGLHQLRLDLIAKMEAGEDIQ